MATIPHAPALPSLVVHVISEVLGNGFTAQDEDYSPENVEDDACFQSPYEDHVLYWHREEEMNWSFYTCYIYVDENGEPASDVAMIELGIGTDFNANQVAISMEFTEDPNGNFETTIQIQSTLHSTDDWRRFMVEHLDPSFERGTDMANKMLDDWSDGDTESVIDDV